MMKSKITITLTWPLLLTLGSIVALGISGIAFGGYLLYNKVVATETRQREIIAQQEAENIARTQEAVAQLHAQDQALQSAKSELKKTQSEAMKTSEQLKTLSKALDQSKAQKDIVISSADVNSYLTGVAQIICVSGRNITSGSGSLFTFKEVEYGVLTNLHVVKDADRCILVMTNSSNTQTGVFALNDAIYSYNHKTDEAILAIGESLSSTSVPIQNYNYSLAKLKQCSRLMAVGTPVVIIGFPAYAKRDSSITIETIGVVSTVYRTVTNGIISGYDSSALGEPNYFVSAKIDNGNSGGIAIAKDANGLCSLGLPTWLTVGNYETQGLVQNIVNILPPKN